MKNNQKPKYLKELLSVVLDKRATWGEVSTLVDIDRTMLNSRPERIGEASMNRIDDEIVNLSQKAILIKKQKIEELKIEIGDIVKTLQQF